MPVDATVILRTALRQLETDRDRVDRQLGALRPDFDTDGHRFAFPGPLTARDCTRLPGHTAGKS
jgi:hypothetical protein